MAWLQSYLEGQAQFSKLGVHQTPVVELEDGVIRASVVRRLLQPGRCHHRQRCSLPPIRHLTVSAYTTQLHDWLFSSRTCTADIRQRYMQNGLQINPDKSKALIVSTTNQLSSAFVAGVDLPAAEDMKVWVLSSIGA